MSKNVQGKLSNYDNYIMNETLLFQPLITIIKSDCTYYFNYSKEDIQYIGILTP